MSEQIDETAQEGSRAASAIENALEDGVTTARRVIKHDGHVITDSLAESRRRLQKNPIESVAATFVAGIATGAAIRWVLRRKIW
jgi:hypothetical protein